MVGGCTKGANPLHSSLTPRSGACGAARKDCSCNTGSEHPIQPCQQALAPYVPMCFLKYIWVEKLANKLHTKDSFRFVGGTRNRNLSSSTILPRVAPTVYPDILSILCEHMWIHCHENYLLEIYILTGHSGCPIWSFSQIACQACHCYLGPGGSTWCRPCSQYWVKSKKLAGRKIIIT